MAEVKRRKSIEQLEALVEAQARDFATLMAAFTSKPMLEEPDDEEPETAPVGNGLRSMAPAGSKTRKVQKAAKPVKVQKAAKPKVYSPLMAGVRRIPHPDPKYAATYSRVVFCGPDGKRFQNPLNPEDALAHDLKSELGNVQPMGRSMLNYSPKGLFWSGMDLLFAGTSVGHIPKEDITWEEFEESDPRVKADGTRVY